MIEKQNQEKTKSTKKNIYFLIKSSYINFFELKEIHPRVYTSLKKYSPPQTSFIWVTLSWICSIFVQTVSLCKLSLYGSLT